MMPLVKAGMFGLVAVCIGLVAIVLWPQQDLPSALRVHIDTPLEAGSELFLVELEAINPSETRPGRTLLLSEFVRADRIQQLDLPESCCSRDTELVLRVVHPGYVSREMALGPLAAQATNQIIEASPESLLGWLRSQDAVGFMQAQVHLDRSRTYLSSLSERGVEPELAVSQALTLSGLRQLVSAVRFTSATEVRWDQREQDQRMLGLRDEYQTLQSQLAEVRRSLSDRPVEMSTPPPF